MQQKDYVHNVNIGMGEEIKKKIIDLRSMNPLPPPNGLIEYCNKKGYITLVYLEKRLGS